MKPSSDSLEVVASEEGWVDDVEFDVGDETVAEGQVGEEGSEDRDTETDNEEDQSIKSVELRPGPG